MLFGYFCINSVTQSDEIRNFTELKQLHRFFLLVFSETNNALMLSANKSKSCTQLGKILLHSNIPPRSRFELKSESVFPATISSLSRKGLSAMEFNSPKQCVMLLHLIHFVVATFFSTEDLRGEAQTCRVSSILAGL